jgi:uncharacterized membrane protein HdeD (DUF308 family)
MADVAHTNDLSEKDDDRRVRIRNQLSTAGWGLLLVWSGTLILLPGDPALLWHAWLLGAGAIVLGVAAVAVRLGSRPGWDTWILGIVGLVSGLAGLFGVWISAIGLGLILFGLAFLAAVVRASVVRRVHSPAAP